jgi:hypothetical protein
LQLQNDKSERVSTRQGNGNNTRRQLQKAPWAMATTRDGSCEKRQDLTALQGSPLSLPKTEKRKTQSQKHTLLRTSQNRVSKFPKTEL